MLDTSRDLYGNLTVLLKFLSLTPLAFKSLG